MAKINGMKLGVVHPQLYPQVMAGDGPVVELGGTAVGNAHGGTVTALLSRVTAPFRARALPDRLAVVFMVMLDSARMFPTNAVAVPIVGRAIEAERTPEDIHIVVKK